MIVVCDSKVITNSENTELDFCLYSCCDLVHQSCGSTSNTHATSVDRVISPDHQLLYSFITFLGLYFVNSLNLRMRVKIISLRTTRWTRVPLCRWNCHVWKVHYSHGTLLCAAITDWRKVTTPNNCLGGEKPFVESDGNIVCVKQGSSQNRTKEST